MKYFNVVVAAIAREWSLLREAMREIKADPRTRQLLLWCLPALLVGLGLRVALTWCLPYGYIQFDTADYLTTPLKLLSHHQLVIHSKKAFFTPLFFTIPFLLHLPALLFIPLAQHCMGMVQILMAGALVRLWFVHWKIFILPVTLYFAASPWMLWFEHTLMGEANFLFFLLATVLAGTLWKRRPANFRFLCFLIFLFITAGTRGEGKLLFLFGFLLVPLVLLPHWRSAALHLVCVLAAFFLNSFVSHQGNALALLSTSLIRLIPEHPKSVPGFDPQFAQVLTSLGPGEWWEPPQNAVSMVKRMNLKVNEFIVGKAAFRNKHDRIKARDAVFKKLSGEAIRTEPWRLLQLPFIKFQMAIDSWPSGRFNEFYLGQKQLYAAKRSSVSNALTIQRLLGRRLSHGEFQQFITEHSRAERVVWFDHYQQAWANAVLAWRPLDLPLPRLRDIHEYNGGVAGGVAVLPGMPYLYDLALLGMLVSLARPGQYRMVHLAWIAGLGFVWYLSMLVGVLYGRYRFAYEPFLFIYLGLLADCFCDALFWITLRLRRPATQSPPASAPQPSA